MVSTEVYISGYQVSEELYNGSRTLVYRGYRESDSLPVVIKLLKNAYPSFNELVQFRNQYTIAKNLNYPGIIQTYNLEPYHNGYALVMEDFGGISLREYIKQNRQGNIQIKTEEILSIAVKIADILHDLHQKRVIHKDIKPANILIHPENKQVKLIDFSIASLLPKETQEIKNPNSLEGTLAYLAPEQTGRMNRGVDYRADFYALGVTLFELLTGELPFVCDDPMELVHCHIAKKPALLPHPNPLLVKERGQEIPQVLSDIVMKLMAKNAEDRYQSVLGLKYDLETCLGQLKETGKVLDFQIAQRDICDRFIIAEKLYGRSREVQTLLDAFARVSSSLENNNTNSNTELMLVAGFSGIGKTAVINEVHKPIVQQRGYFIKGKFDQFNRNIPLSAFVQALRNLLRQLLSDTDARLAVWRSQISAAIGTEGQVLIEVIPELERLIGVQPAVETLSGVAAQHRFNRLFQQFVRVFTRPQHPLVLFLDDLQWADLSSLKLLQLLMEDRGNLLILGAYRDNEVSPIHPFIQTVEELKKGNRTVNTITLPPLKPTDINSLVADTLGCDRVIAEPLTKLIAQKTKGNPFFTTQFLQGLHQDGYITFNRDLGVWECDIVQVRSLALTDDVVTFMVQQLQKLPESTQIALQRAACIGAEFDLKTLAIICQLREHQAADALWPALGAGLILPISDNYKFFHSQQEVEQEREIRVPYRFLHDRVQQASYALIAEEQKQSLHWTIGQLLLQNTPESELEDRIFNIVNQLNQRGKEHLTVTEGCTLAELNLIAARKARKNTAYGTAYNNARIGIDYLPADAWQSQYSFTLALHSITVETAYLSGEFVAMEEWVAITLSHCQTILDRIPIQESKILACVAQQKPTDAIAIGLESLKLLGVDIPFSPTDEQFQQALQTTLTQMEEVGLENLLDLPPMDNPEIEAAAGILIKIGPACLGSNPLLYLMTTLAQVQLALKHGHNALSAIGYSNYVILLNIVLKDFDTAFRLSDIALELCQKFFSKAAAAQSLTMIGIFARHWKLHLRETLPLLRQGREYGMESGEYDMTSWGYFNEGWILYLLGTELSELKVILQNKSDAIAQIKQSTQLGYNQALRQTTLNLLGEEVEDICTLTGSVFNETEGFAEYQAAGEIGALFCGYLYKLILSYLFSRYEQAINLSESAFNYIAGVGGKAAVPPFYLFTTLAKLAVYDTATPEEQAAILELVNSHQATIQNWASHAPMNYSHYADLVAAEKSRCLGDKADAIIHYESAVQTAKENGYIQDEALANELTAKFYLNWGKEKAALGYMQEAYYCYARWGAKAKTDDLEKRYPNLLKPILGQRQLTLNPWETIATVDFPHKSSVNSTSTSCSTNISDVLDFTSILKAAQTISSNIELDELITNLTTIILQNSGAKKSVLILPEKNNWQVRAITFINHQNDSQPKIKTILDSQLIDTCQDIPIKIINYVKNTQETLAIDNCQTNISDIIDEYILELQPKSVLCTPILNQRHLVGILYLENKLASGVFTNERLQVIKLLSSQAAISLENAQLYQQAQQALEDLQQAQLQIVQSEKMSALGNLVAGVAHEMNNPLGFINASLKQTKPIFDDIIEHLKLYQESLPNPDEEIIEHAEDIDLDYSLEDLPKMLDSMVMACDRLKKISTSLRTFSRADQDYKVAFNIHQGIDSTILILKHRLKANEQRPGIEVITDYGNLPQIECFPGQLNQVFMNILANAIDALEDFNTGRTFEEIKANPNKITVQTSIDNNNVKIKIADNGKGMSEETKNKIFEHLFTTKGVGQGTGLGLAIAKQIIEEKHGGKLSCNSVFGEGTEFVIEIPV